MLIGDDIGAGVAVGMDVEIMFEFIVVIGPINDGDTVNLVGDVDESSTISILLYGFTDMFHLYPVDSSLWFAILVRTACFYFDEMQGVVFHSNKVEFASPMQIPVVVQDQITIVGEI